MSDASIWKPGSTSALVNAETSSLSENFTAGDNQTLFTLTNFQYVVNTGSLEVYVNGVYQRAGIDFTETSSSSFTLTFECDADDVVVAKGLVGSTNTASAAVSAAAALVSQNAAAVSEANALQSEINSLASESAASSSQTAASTFAQEAEDWANKTTGTVDGVEYSSKYYSQQAASEAIDAAASAATAASYASVGFDVASSLYDFGFITDASLTFTTDYGSIA